jgi:hypothetical protein
MGHSVTVIKPARHRSIKTLRPARIRAARPAAVPQDGEREYFRCGVELLNRDVFVWSMGASDVARPKQDRRYVGLVYQ